MAGAAEGMMICAECGASIPNHVQFCPKCGTKVGAVPASSPSTKRCPMCGEDNPISAKFCKADAYTFPPVGQVPPIDLKEPKDALSCPKCGTSYPLTALFCRNDGTTLKGAPAAPPEAQQPSLSKETAQLPESGAAYPVREETNRVVLTEAVTQPEPPHPDLPPRGGEGTPRADSSQLGGRQVKVAAQPEIVDVRAEVVKRSSRSWLWPAVAGVVLLLISGAGYLYYAGFFGKDAAKVEMQLDAELKAQGLDNIYVKVSKDWVATVSGFVENEADKGRVLGIVESNKDVKDIEDRITVASTKGSSANGATESPGAQPPSMRSLEEAIKRGVFE